MTPALDDLGSNYETMIAPPTQAALESFCRTHHITRLAVFGSAVRGELTPDSDIDVLVAFEEGHTPGWEFFGLQDEMAALLGRKVDLGTFGGLHGAAGPHILREAVTLYDAH